MSDTIDDFRAMNDARAKVRKAYGLPCPRCRDKQPKREPTIMLPGQRCKVDRFVDPRPPITDEQWIEAVND